MKKLFLLLAVCILSIHASTQQSSITATYVGDVFTTTGWFSHVIDVKNNTTTSLDIMLECDGYVSYYTIPGNTTVRTLIDFNGGKGITYNRVKITILNSNISPIMLIIKRSVMI